MAPRCLFPAGWSSGFCLHQKVFGGQVSFGHHRSCYYGSNRDHAPAGFVVTNIYALASDMDSNGTPTLVQPLATPAALLVFLSASTIGQAGTSTTSLADGQAFYYQFPADTILQPSANAATAVVAFDHVSEGFMANPYRGNAAGQNRRGRVLNKE